MIEVEKLKQKILDLAIRGKLVPQDPNDEPASVLIEKIKKEKEQLVKEGKIKASKNDSYIYKGSDNCYYKNTGNETNIVECNLDIPNGWFYTKLKTIIILLSGIDLELSDMNTSESGVPYITGASNFQNNSLTVNRWTNKPKTISYCGDILITVKGTVGKLSFNNIGQIHIARQVMAISVNKEINPNYIMLFLKSMIFNLQDKKTGIIPGITRDKILDLDVFIPPVLEQNRIVETVKEQFRLIDSIEKDYESINEYVLRVKHIILENIFNENSSYKSYYKNYIKFEEDVEIFDNLRKPINRETRLNRISNTKILYPYYGSTGQSGLIDDYIFDGEYVLLGEDGAPFLDKNATKAYIVNGKFWVNNHAHILKSKTNNKFLEYYLDWIDYSNYVTGTTRLKLNQKMLRKILIPNMPKSIKEKIVDKMEAAINCLSKISNQ